MDITAVFSQMIVLLLLMAAGYVASLCGIITREGEKVLSKFVVNIACPALIISSVTTSERLSDDRLLFITILIAVIYYVVMPFVAILINKVLRIPQKDAAQYELILVYSNLGFMGIPVISSIYGNSAILYLSIFMSIFNVSIFSYGYLRLQENRSESGISLKRIVNAGTVSALFAITCYILGLHLPSIILRPIELVGSTTTPLSMMVIGATLTKFKVLDVIRDARAWIYTALKLLVLPIATYLLLRFFIQDAMLLGVITIVSGMPVASMVVMMCNETNHDSTAVDKTIFLSTVLSVVTIPLLTLIL